MFIQRDWSLFLDRDGVINRRIPGAYIQHWADFEFLPGVLESFPVLAEKFRRIFIVTNQQGVGKGLMTEAQLAELHARMTEAISDAGGRLDATYHCPALASLPGNCRKPAPTMGQWARRDFPEVDFRKSVMVGDSLSDMQFGTALGMKTVLVTSKREEREQIARAKAAGLDIDRELRGLAEFAALI